MNPNTSPLLTDLYQLTMLQAYFEQGMHGTAVFEFFIRALPGDRNFLIAAGLEQALDFLEKLRFDAEELDWLARRGGFSEGFLEHLADLRFTGEVHAMPEGTLIFAHEPMLRVTAPIMQAQLVESRLINLLHFQTLVASKAARSVLVAPEKLLVDFGMRRAHGAEAALLAARASYLAGFAGSATALAGPAFGVPTFGTMAHSYIQAHASELAAFESFARAMPGSVTLLIDTYDTEAGAEKLATLAPKLRERGITIQAVRLDSGDLADHARKVRAILDHAGLTQVRIFCSGNIDEYKIEALQRGGAPIDGYGVGTHMVTSSDAPLLDCAYKLQEYAGLARRKRSEGKATWPGRKQVYRYRQRDGTLGHDVVTLEADRQAGEALLQPVMRDGARVVQPVPMQELRAYTRRQLQALPERLRSLEPAAPPYPVEISAPLRALADEVDRRPH